MGYSEILSELKQKKYRPIYFLQGEEPYYMDKITDFISNNVLKEGERDFNQTILYGKDVTVQDIVNTSKRYPMMAPYQVVIVKEAQHLIRTIDQLSTYAENPTTTTILVFNYKYKKLDGRKALGKQLKKLGYLETFDKIRDYKLPDWIVDYCRDESLQISPKGAMMLSEFLGNDLNKISNTIEKLKVVLDGDTTIDASVIERNVGISKEFNLFELHGALADKDILKANLICNHFGENPKNYPLVVTLSSLYGYFTKLMKYHFLVSTVPERELAAKVGVHAFFLKDYSKAAQNYTKNKLAKIFGYLREYDLKAKGVNNVSTTDSELLRELVFKILH